MAYNEYSQSGQSLGKILYQLSKIGVPVNIVENIILNSHNELYYQNKMFGLYKWTEIDIPVFKFVSEYDIFNKLEQPKYVVLKGSNCKDIYEDAGTFINVNGIAFREAVAKYSKTYISDFDGRPLREQILNPTTFEDKFKRLKNKFSK